MIQPMARRAQGSLVTAEELNGLPGDGKRYELVAGRLIAEPPTGGRHGVVAARIVTLLSNFVQAHDLGAILTTDPGFILARSPDTVRAPDVAFLSRRRLEEMESVESFLPGPPDLAVEILSPSDGPGAVRAKVTDYLEAGTHLVWVVDPSRRCVTVFRPLEPPLSVTGDQILEGEDVLPGFLVPVSEIFRF